jgi:hypothetical protein
MSPAVGRFAWGLLIAGMLVVPLSATEPPDDPARRIDDALAVQTAMKLGTDALRAGRPKQAVEILEAQVHRINGNARYLMLLRDAYCAYLRDCQDTEPAEVLAQTARALSDPRPARRTHAGSEAAAHLLTRRNAQVRPRTRQRFSTRQLGRSGWPGRAVDHAHTADSRTRDARSADCRTHAAGPVSAVPA